MGRYPNHLVKKEPEIDIVDLLEVRIHFLQRNRSSLLIH